MTILPSFWFGITFFEAAYFATLYAVKSPSALSHMLAGVSCCGCTEPLAIAQKYLEDVPVEDNVKDNIRISPATDLLYEGFFHLIEAMRLEPSVKAPSNLIPIFDTVADDMAYVSRRELHTPPDKVKRYTLRLASISAAILLRRFTDTQRELPGISSSTIDTALEIIETELSRKMATHSSLGIYPYKNSNHLDQ